MENRIPTKRYCYNCGRLLYGERSEDRTARFSCRACGVSIFSKIKSRRKEEVVVYLPEGEYIADSGMDASGF